MQGIRDGVPRRARFPCGAHRNDFKVESEEGRIPSHLSQLSNLGTVTEEDLSRPNRNTCDAPADPHRNATQKTVDESATRTAKAKQHIRKPRPHLFISDMQMIGGRKLPRILVADFNDETTAPNCRGFRGQVWRTRNEYKALVQKT